MPRKDEKRMIVGLDIGTSKVVAIVGELDNEDKLEVIGIGTHPSRGLKKGVVVNIESTVQSIQKAAIAAEEMAGCEIHSVFTGIAGSHIRSLNSHGMTPIKNKEVTADDLRQGFAAVREELIRETGDDAGSEGLAIFIHSTYPGR